jgi:hypothetical protein
MVSTPVFETENIGSIPVGRYVFYSLLKFLPSRFSRFLSPQGGELVFFLLAKKIKNQKVKT